MSGEKAKIRREIIRRRKLLSGRQYRMRSDGILAHTTRLIEDSGVGCLHSYLPITQNKEPNTLGIIDYCLDKGVRVLTTRTNLETMEMRHYQLERSTLLAFNELRIPEPFGGVSVHPDQADMILVPLVAVDKKGNRIGYGKGYYDRLLASLPERVIRVGLCVSSLFDFLPFEQDYDMRMDLCVTPTGSFRCLR